jgi:N-acetyl sugar amidotransferase
MESLPKGIDAKQKLDQLIKQIKSDGYDKRYDCIIGLSGGVDSTYVAYLVKEEFGLRPLAVHLDNGWNSALSIENMKNIIDKLEIDLYTHTIDLDEFRDIQLSFLKASTPDSEIPTDHAIFSLLKQVAKKNNVKYVLNGINIKTESHHALSWSQGHSDFGYIKSVQRKFGTKPIRTFPHGNRLTLLEGLFSKSWINILNYIDYNKAEAKKIITERLNWQDYGGKHFESTYTKFFQGHILPKKFGYDKRKMHLSSLICAGEITREAALEELKKPPYPLEEQMEDKNILIDRFCITHDEFEEIMTRAPKTYYDYPSYYGHLINCKMLNFIKKIIKKAFLSSKTSY